MVDKEALFALSVEDRMRTIYKLSKDELIGLICNAAGEWDDVLISRLADESRNNPEIYQKLVNEEKS